MSSFPPPDEDLLICPNCKTVNHPNVDVCVGCGINLANFAEIQNQLSARQEQKSSEKLQQLRDSAESHLIERTKQSRRTFFRQLLVVLATTCVLIPIFWGIGSWIKYQQTKKMQKVEEQIQLGEDCFTRKDYLCAIDAYEYVVENTTDYKNAEFHLLQSHLGLIEEYLNVGQTYQAIDAVERLLQIKPEESKILSAIFESRLRIAEQLSVSGKWEEAINQLDLAMEIRPGNAKALNIIKSYYDQWYEDTLSQGDKVKAWWIRRTRDARFPK